MSCFKAIFPCCFPPTGKNGDIVLEEAASMEIARNDPSPLRSVMRSPDATILHQPGGAEFIHSVLPEIDFCPPLCSTKLPDEELLRAKSDLEVCVSFHTGGTLSNSFWQDIKRWDDKTNVVGNRESLVRRHTLASADTKLALRNCSINEFDMTNVLPVCPFPVDLTQSNSTIACDSRVPSMANVGPKTATGEERTAENGPRLSISDDEGCVYDVTSYEASLSPMQASFVVGSMPNIAEGNGVAITRKHSVDSNLSSTGTPFLSAMSSRSRFTVAPVDEHLHNLRFKDDGSVLYKSS